MARPIGGGRMVFFVMFDKTYYKLIWNFVINLVIVFGAFSGKVGCDFDL